MRVQEAEHVPDGDRWHARISTCHTAARWNDEPNAAIDVPNEAAWTVGTPNKRELEAMENMPVVTPVN